VTSLIAVISRPAACNDLIAASRPAPGPLTHTSTLRKPWSIASFAEALEASWAANGVDFFDPLNPDLPAVDQAITPPVESVIETIVLLKVALIWTTPFASIRLAFFLLFFFFASANENSSISQLQ
jgi:hypothetical protein